MDLTTLAAIVYVLMTTVAVAFQCALALGVPWGAYAMGGAFPGRMPPVMRAAAVAQAIVLGVMAAVVLSRAGLALPGWSRASAWLIWVIVGFTAIGVVLNAISPSAGERRVWTPVTLLLLVCSLTVALSARP